MKYKVTALAQNGAIGIVIAGYGILHTGDTVVLDSPPSVAFGRQIYAKVESFEEPSEDTVKDTVEDKTEPKDEVVVPVVSKPVRAYRKRK